MNHRLVNCAIVAYSKIISSTFVYSLLLGLNQSFCPYIGLNSNFRVIFKRCFQDNLWILILFLGFLLLRANLQPNFFKTPFIQHHLPILCCLNVVLCLFCFALHIAMLFWDAINERRDTFFHWHLLLF